MSLDLSAVNWWAVLVAAGASFVLGGVWYMVLFGKAWRRVYGFSDEDLERMGAHPERTFPTLFLCDLVAAAVVAVLAAQLGIVGAPGGVALGLVLGLGVIGAGTLATATGSGRPVKGWLIDAGKHVASFIVMGAILGAWR